MTILSFADLHTSPRWLERSRLILDFIMDQVKTIQPDLLLNCGDFFDGLNPDDKSIIWIREWVQEICKYATFAGVYGTPSHDSPGCYHSWKPYGYIDLELGKPFVHPSGVVLFGIPELTKANIKDKSNESFNNLLSSVITDHIAPVRAQYKMPAVVVLHGEVIDTADIENTLKSSGRNIKTGILEKISAQYYLGGHIHKPWMSENIPFEYCGGTGHDSRPWSNRGFQPHMIRLEWNDQASKFVRSYIDYPVNRKEKVLINKEGVFNPDKTKRVLCPDNEDLWIEYHRAPGEDVPRKNILDYFRGKGFDGEIKFTVKQPPQEIKFTPVKKENPSPLDFAQSLNPELTRDQENIIKEISQINTSRTEPREIDLLSVYYGGVKLLNPPNGGLNYSGHNPGLIRLSGDTGSGKSTKIGLSYPLPGIIKDTDSGQARSFGCFFDPPGEIIREYTINGAPVREEIHITPKKTEYYLSGEGAGPGLKTSNYQEFLENVQDLFGEEHILLNSIFQVQAAESRRALPSLSHCSTTELRGVFLSLLGMSREKEKRVCLEKIRKYEKEIVTAQIKIESREKDAAFLMEKKDKIINTLSLFSDIEGTIYQNQIAKEEKEALEKKLNIAHQNGIKARAADEERKRINKKCPKCGYQPPNIKARLDNLKNSPTELKQTIQEFTKIKTALSRITTLSREDENNLKEGALFIRTFDDNTHRIDEEITFLKQSIERYKKKLEDWKIVKALFCEGGIPTLEIAHNQESIEQVINDKLNIFEEGRYSARIEVFSPTANGKGIKEKFDILIDDTQRGEERSFCKYSGGEKQIIGIAIREGAIAAMEEFHGLKYLFRFVDEGDSGISPKYINQYYDILRSSGKKVYVTTHIVQDDNIFDLIIS